MQHRSQPRCSAAAPARATRSSTVPAEPFLRCPSLRCSEPRRLVLQQPLRLQAKWGMGRPLGASPPAGLVGAETHLPVYSCERRSGLSRKATKRREPQFSFSQPPISLQVGVGARAREKPHTGTRFNI